MFKENKENHIPFFFSQTQYNIREIVTMFRTIQKYFAVKKILQKLPSALVKKYGVKDKNKYTQEQVKTMMEIEKLNQDYIHYAYAIFLTYDEAVQYVGDKKKIFNIKMEVVGKYLGRGQELKDLFCTAVKIGNYGFYWFYGGDYSRHDSGGSGGDNSGSDSGGGSC